MSFYHLAVHHLVHTCPANEELHVWATTREVIGIIDGGPCQTPATVRSGNTVTEIPCGRAVPADKQCRACRTTTIETSVTTTETGPIK